jgi:hypothetical protein
VGKLTWFFGERMKNLHEDVLALIKCCRDSFPDSVKVYTNGSCFRFFKILKSVFRDSEPYYNIVEGHVITKINDRYYDITGEISPKGYFPMTNEPNILNDANEWMYRK